MPQGSAWRAWGGPAIERLLSVQETARKFGVSTPTIRRLMAAGRLQGQKVGGQWRFAEDAIDALYRSGALSNLTQPQGNEYRLESLEGLTWSAVPVAKWRAGVLDYLATTVPDHVVANDRRGAKTWSLLVPNHYVWGKTLWHSTATELMSEQELRRQFKDKTVLLFDEMIQHGRAMHHLRERLEAVGARRVDSLVCVRSKSHARSGDLQEFRVRACEDLEDAEFAGRASVMSRLIQHVAPPLDVDHLVVHASLRPEVPQTEILDRLANWGVPFTVWHPDAEQRMWALTLDRPRFFDTSLEEWRGRGFAFSWTGPCKLRFYVDPDEGTCYCSFVVYPWVEASQSAWSSVLTEVDASDTEINDGGTADRPYRRAYAFVCLNLAASFLSDFIASGAAADIGIRFGGYSHSVDEPQLRATFGPKGAEHLSSAIRRALAQESAGGGLFKNRQPNPPSLSVRSRVADPQEATSIDLFDCRQDFMKVVPSRYPDGRPLTSSPVAYASLQDALRGYAEPVVSRVLDLELDRATVNPQMVVQHMGDNTRVGRGFIRGEFGVWYEWDANHGVLTYQDDAIQRILGAGPKLTDYYLKKTDQTEMLATHFNKVFVNLQHDLRQNEHDLFYLGWRPYKYGPVPVVPKATFRGDNEALHVFLANKECLEVVPEVHGAKTWSRYRAPAASPVPWEALYQTRLRATTRSHIESLVAFYADVQLNCSTVRSPGPEQPPAEFRDSLVVLASVRNQETAYRSCWWEFHDWRAQRLTGLFPVLQALALKVVPDAEQSRRRDFLQPYIEAFAAPGDLLFNKLEMYQRLPNLREQLKALVENGDYPVGQVVLETVDEVPVFDTASPHPMANLRTVCAIMRAFSSLTRQVLTACGLDRDTRGDKQRVDAEGRPRDIDHYLRALFEAMPDLRLPLVGLSNCADQVRGGVLTPALAENLSRSLSTLLGILEAGRFAPDPRPVLETRRDQQQAADGLRVRLSEIPLPPPYAVGVLDVRNFRNLPRLGELMGVDFDAATVGIEAWIQSAAKRVAKNHPRTHVPGLAGDSLVLASASADELLDAVVDVMTETSGRLEQIDRNQLAPFVLFRAGLAWRDDTMGPQFRGPLKPGYVALSLAEAYQRPAGTVAVSAAVYDRLSEDRRAQLAPLGATCEQGDQYCRLLQPPGG
jgi:excisionase family DNA binding protein